MTHQSRTEPIGTQPSLSQLSIMLLAALESPPELMPSTAACLRCVWCEASCWMQMPPSTSDSRTSISMRLVRQVCATEAVDYGGCRSHSGPPLQVLYVCAAARYTDDSFLETSSHPSRECECSIEVHFRHRSSG